MLASTTEMIEYTAAEELAAVYKESTAAIAAAIAEIGEHTRRLKAAYGDEYAFALDLYYDGRSRDASDRGTAEIMDGMKRQAWGKIIEKIGITKLMSAKRVGELRQALAGKGNGETSFPEIHPETIQQVAQGYLSSATEFLEEAVAEEYDHWRPNKNHADYVRNSEWKLNRKIIRPWMVEIGWSRGTYRLSYHNGHHVTALDSIFHMLAGLGPVKQYKGPLAAAIETAADGVGETDFFRFKCFKNGNLHLEFRRQDLLDLFNQIAGKNRLGHDR